MMQALPPPPSQPPSYQVVITSTQSERKLRSTQSKQSLENSRQGGSSSRTNLSLIPKPSMVSLRNMRTHSSANLATQLTVQTTIECSIRPIDSTTPVTQPRPKWFKRMLSRSSTASSGNSEKSSTMITTDTRSEGDEGIFAVHTRQTPNSSSRRFRGIFDDGVPYAEMVSWVGKAFRSVNGGW